MTREEYQRALEMMEGAFRSFVHMAIGIEDADVVIVDETARRAEAVGWALDPTAYRNSIYSGSLARQRELIALFKDTRGRLDKLYPRDAEIRKLAHAAVAADPERR